MIYRRIYKCRTRGERGNHQNPLTVDVGRPHSHNVLEWIENDEFAIVMAYSENNDFSAYEKVGAVQLFDQKYLDKRQTVRKIKNDGTILNSSSEIEIGKKIWNINKKMSKIEWEKAEEQIRGK